MNTCGLDHILGADEAPADQYLYPRKKFVTNTIHGRISTVPARLGGYGERVTQPGEIVPAIKRAIKITQEGTPALLEFITAKEIQYSIYK